MLLQRFKCWPNNNVEFTELSREEPELAEEKERQGDWGRLEEEAITVSDGKPTVVHWKPILKAL